jgi:chromosome transmission fidelity protein 1
MRTFESQQESQRQEERNARRTKRMEKAKAKLGPRSASQQQQRQLSAPASDDPDDPDAEFLVEGWASGGEGTAGGSAGGKRPAPLRQLSDTDDSDSDAGGVGEDEALDAPHKTQIIFCSRTHSQLSQFVGELHRTPFAESMSLVALGARRALCVNDAVLRLSAPALINERCLELQKPPAAKKKAAGEGSAAAAAPRPRKAPSGRCPYLAPGSKAADTTRDMILAHPIDVEELARLGRRRSVCSYYAARRAVPEADVVLAPYSALLVAEARRSLGLRVEGSVVILDEGHNLGELTHRADSSEGVTCAWVPGATAFCVRVPQVRGAR